MTTTDREIVEHFIKYYEGKSLQKDLKYFLDDAEKTQLEMDRMYNAQQTERDRRLQYDGEMAKRHKLIQNGCKHSWRFIPDASGNNDSEYVCRMCELRQDDV